MPSDSYARQKELLKSLKKYWFVITFQKSKIILKVLDQDTVSYFACGYEEIDLK